MACGISCLSIRKHEVPYTRGPRGGEFGVFDAETGLYGIAVAQVTLLGEHDEFSSFGEAFSEGDFASRLFEGGMRIHWNESLGSQALVDGVNFVVPSPSGAALFACGGLAAARRRR